MTTGTDEHHRPHTLIALTLVGACLGGCQTAAPLQRGRIEHVQPGGQFVDFTFGDDEGRRHFISRHMGDYTLIAFTRCDTDTHMPAARTLQGMVSELNDLSSTRVVGINVHWSDSPAAHHDGDCHLVDGDNTILSICDATGAIHLMYGVSDENRLFLIGPDRHVISREPLSRADQVQDMLEELVSDLERERTFESYSDQ